MSLSLAADGVELPDEEQLTAARDETKYQLETEHIGLLMAELTRRLPSHRYVGEGANRLPDPHHYITTVYFDTPSRDHFHASRRDRHHNVKVRAREYYDVHPSLAELATRPNQVVKYGPWVFFEVKRRHGTRTLKDRFRLARTSVLGFVEGMASAAPDVHEEWSVGERASAEAASRYLRDLGVPLVPCCLVNYRRVSWQQSDIGLRLTLDLGITFYRPPLGMWSQPTPLVRSALGQARGFERRAVLEVKERSPAPDWLRDLLFRVRAERSEFSKFLGAMEVLVATGG